MKQSSPNTVMLADNFPAKAYLLVTYLTENDPNVSSFSSDGNSFEIYDQSIFASKYLPQYFKHSNYGSFVRQLNLYGFTSSRLKSNNDVVVWSHECFRRDRKDLVKDIKRTKKAKSSKPSHVHINPRSPSPPSLSDDVSSEAVPSKISRKDSLIDQNWLASEFAFLKRQNQYLEQKMEQQNRRFEQKLDTLIQLTLRIAPAAAGDAHAGEKRRRMSPVESSNDAAAYHGLGSVYEEQKLFYEDNYGFAPAYEGEDSKMPHEDFGAGHHEFGARNDSLKRFCDIMLNEEDEEACKEDGSGRETSSTAASTNLSQSETMNVATSYPPPPDSAIQRTLDDELMEEAVNAVLPAASFDTDGGDLFEDLTEVAEDTTPQLHQTSNHGAFMSNAVVDKHGGPQPIRSISSSEVPPMQSGGGDIEEGNLPVGVHVIEAHAELVEGSGYRQDSNVSSEAPLLQESRRYRKRMLLLVGFIGVCLVVGVTWPAVVITKKQREKHEVKSSSRGPHGKHKPFTSSGTSGDFGYRPGPGWRADSNGEGLDDDLLDDDEVTLEAVTETVVDPSTTTSSTQASSVQSISRSFPNLSPRARTHPLFDHGDDSVTSFSVTVEGGIEFVCTREEDLPTYPGRRHLNHFVS